MPSISLNRRVQERRRLRAIQLLERGWTPTRIATALGVSRPAVYQWLQKHRSGGDDALKAQPRSGAPRRLTERHQQMLVVLLHAPPRENGLEFDVWDRRLVQSVIRRLFGVEYSLPHAGRILKSVQREHQLLNSSVDELRNLLTKADIASIQKRLGIRHAQRTERRS
jgi:transposase